MVLGTCTSMGKVVIIIISRKGLPITRDKKILTDVKSLEFHRRKT